MKSTHLSLKDEQEQFCLKTISADVSTWSKVTIPS